jgi:hypothetical protein
VERFETKAKGPDTVDSEMEHPTVFVEQFSDLGSLAGIRKS